MESECTFGPGAAGLTEPLWDIADAKSPPNPGLTESCAPLLRLDDSVTFVDGSTFVDIRRRTEARTDSPIFVETRLDRALQALDAGRGVVSMSLRLIFSPPIISSRRSASWRAPTLFSEYINVRLALGEANFSWLRA
eukprot:2570585-Prymnesium_polylepis.1